MGKLETDPQTILDAVREQIDGSYAEEFAGWSVNRATGPGEAARAIVAFAAAGT